MAEDYTPDPNVFDDYRCFLIDPKLAEDIFLTGFDVRPGAPQMVHHLTLYAIDTPEAEAEAEAIDAAEAGPGYSCLDDIRIPDTRWLVGWGPGGGTIKFPEGTGQTCVAQVNRWNFHWQGFAHYTKPVHVGEGDSLRITCTYDTMIRDTETN